MHEIMHHAIRKWKMDASYSTGILVDDIMRFLPEFEVGHQYCFYVRCTCTYLMVPVHAHRVMSACEHVNDASPYRSS